MLMADALFWAQSSYRHTPLLGLCFSAFLHGGAHDPAIPMAVIIEENGALRVVDVGSDDAARARTSPRPGEVVRGSMMCLPQPHTSGLLAPALVKFDHTVLGMAESTPIRPAEWTQLRPMYVSFLRNQWRGAGWISSDYFVLLASGDGTTTRIRWGWLVHDVLAVGLVVWAFASWRACGATEREERRRGRNAALLSQNRCPGCGYDVAGIRHGPDRSRPECGRSLSP